VGRFRPNAPGTPGPGKRFHLSGEPSQTYYLMGEAFDKAMLEMIQ